MSDTVRQNIARVRHFVRDFSGQVLQRIGEELHVDAQWRISSHGAAARVVGPHDAHFERTVVILPKPKDASTARFREWSEKRLEHFGWYVESCNIGTGVQTIFHDIASVGIFMLRKGRPIGDPRLKMAPAQDVPALLERFATNVELYVRNLGDDSLKFVRDIRCYPIPRVKVEDQYVLGIDVLPTVIGLEHEPVPINPLTLVRGVIGEVTEMVDQRRDEVAAMRSGLRPWSYFRISRQLRSIKRILDGLDSVCERIDLERPALSTVRSWLQKLKEGKPKGTSSLTQVVLIIVGVTATVWLFMTP